MAFSGFHWREEEHTAHEHHPFLYEDDSECNDARVGKRRLMVVDLALIFQTASQMTTPNITMMIVFYFKLSFLIPSSNKATIMERKDWEKSPFQHKRFVVFGYIHF